MAGARLADELRQRDPSGEVVSVTVIGAEPGPAYNRVLLPHVVEGAMAASAVLTHNEHWAKANNVELLLSTQATAIDRAGRTVTLDNGVILPYDTLVLATGAGSWVPPTEGLLDETGSLADGVVSFRTLLDCESLTSRAMPGAPVVVLGGGLLGLETARVLVNRGCQVTVVHPVDRLMERHLDATAGGILAKLLKRHGIRFRLDRRAVRYLPGAGVILDDASFVPAALLVIAAGVREETHLARAGDLTVDRGVVVDDSLRTSDPHIHAVGDVAQHPGTVSGAVQPAWEQAQVLADLLTGTDTTARYHGTPVVTRLKVREVDLSCLGDVHVDVDSEKYEVVCLIDATRGRYAKLVLSEDRVHGAILLGVPDAAATIAHHYDSRTAVPNDRLALLLGRALPEGGVDSVTPDAIPDSATVCRCNNVTKLALVDAWRDGATTSEQLVRVTGATTTCGTCTNVVAGVANWLTRRSSGTDPAAESDAAGVDGGPFPAVTAPRAPAVVTPGRTRS
jgi:assimilatory nitrate reductase electron transfer subunit